MNEKGTSTRKFRSKIFEENFENFGMVVLFLFVTGNFQKIETEFFIEWKALVHVAEDNSILGDASMDHDHAIRLRISHIHIQFAVNFEIRLLLPKYPNSFEAA